MQGKHDETSSSKTENNTSTGNDPYLELLEICNLYDIKNFSVIDLNTARNSFKEAIVFTNWPMSFLENVKSFDLHQRTELPELASNTIAPFNWKFDTIDGKLLDISEELLTESTMLDGLMLPIRSSADSIFIFVFNGIEKKLSNTKLGSLLLASVNFVDCHSANQTKSIINAKSNLTALEVEGLKMQSEGKSKSEISEQWGFSEHTVNTCLSNTYEKMGANTCCQAVSIAVTQGIIC